MKISSTIVYILLILISTPSEMIGKSKKQSSPIQRVDPPNWWTNMAEEMVELTFYGPNIQQYEISLSSENSSIKRISKAKNPNYLFVQITISKDQKPGDLIFQLRGPKKKLIEYRYPLLGRDGSYSPQGLNGNDLIYLVFPDRFSNGDPTNDVNAGMKEQGVDRSALKARHGGDLQGVQNHLDYLSEIGTTALWINPVLENNQPLESYHGYAATDLYKVDPRFGTNESYRELVNACHKRGIKMIWDVVYNHWGNENWMFKDLPDSNWVHWFPEFTRTSYRAEVLMDPYASDFDKNQMTDSWFDKHMPDLNQQDPFLARYLIQNSIWWIEYAQLDAFRIDTYAYPDQQFMKQLNEAIRKQYPNFFLFGETWVQGSSVQSWFTENAFVKKDYSSSLHGVTDFQLYYAINKGLTENFGWEEGFRRIELTLSHDILYNNPYNIVTFLDNHDLSRFYSMMNESFENYKMGIALLYTLRGIPSIYYGTEILMKNYADPDAKVREDFPGGWAGDKVNKFTAEGRNEKENQAFNFCKTLGTWRKNQTWFGNSNLKQFVPNDNVYVYFRYDDQHTVMCIYNGNQENFELKLDRFNECLKGKKVMHEVISGSQQPMGATTIVPSRTVQIFEIKE